MPGQTALSKIEKEIQKLTPRDQVRLMERLVQQLRKNRLAGRRVRSWAGLYGLGKELWKGEDAQEYVTRLRADRA